MPTPSPDPAPAPGTAADRTVRLGTPADEAARTVRLGAEPAGAAEGTVRLGAGPVAASPDTEATVRLDSAEAASATFLDPRVWGAAEAGETTTRVQTPAHGSTVPALLTSTVPAPPLTSTVEASTPAEPSGPTATVAPQGERSFAPGELRRFGPGVPPQAAAVWHGAPAADAPQPARPRRVRRWLVPVAVLLAVLAFLFWRFTMPALAVTGVGVTTDPAGPGCGGTAVITAAVETNGGAGTVRYRWQRSDGTTSGEIAQDVRSGAHHTDLVLRWSFEGQGSFQATATLEILSPAPRTAATSFTYHCS
ncbi:hypothetical protein OH807_37615 [Kitasatospora sp. NBC_01560]|uniref:hypothetical protein n=1 Tax=Kitasatospora sp. NBC_01560 TaxID=2975965 RepID=UPI003866175F